MAMRGTRPPSRTWPGPGGAGQLPPPAKPQASEATNANLNIDIVFLLFWLDYWGCPIRSLPNGWGSLKYRLSGTTLHQLPTMRYEKHFVQWVRAYCILDYKAWPLLEDRWDWGEPRNGRG